MNLTYKGDLFLFVIDTFGAAGRSLTSKNTIKRDRRATSAHSKLKQRRVFSQREARLCLVHHPALTRSNMIFTLSDGEGEFTTYVSGASRKALRHEQRRLAAEASTPKEKKMIHPPSLLIPDSYESLTFSKAVEKRPDELLRQVTEILQRKFGGIRVQCKTKEA